MTLLLFGATGRTGKHVLSYALSKKSRNLDEGKESDSSVYVYARNPSKIPEDQREQVTIIQGDYLDDSLVKKTIEDVKPDQIIITTALPMNSLSNSLNSLVIPRIVEALQKHGRLSQCYIIQLNDAFAKIPDKNMPWSLKILSMSLVPFLGIKAAVRDDQATVDYLYSTPQELKFSTAHMGRAEEKPSQGDIHVSDTVASSVAFIDVGKFLVDLAYSNGCEKNVCRQGFYMNY